MSQATDQNGHMAKDKLFNVRLDADDKERLEVLSKHYALPAANVIRMLIKRDFDAVGGRVPVDPAST